MEKTIKAEARAADTGSTPAPSAAAKPKAAKASKPASGARLGIEKTYKLYIGGKFPRTESGRYFTVEDAKGDVVANMCRGSRKDFREAVVAARGALNGWSAASAYLRSQILYRIAEMLEGRAEQYVLELQQMGATKRAAAKEVTEAIDCLVYYAGWADKYQQIFSSVNPVASSHFNFSILEPVGVVSLLASKEKALLGFVADLAPIIAGGNTVVALASEANPLPAISFAEALHSSDVPAGAVNILSGYRSELTEHFASHMDVNAIVVSGGDVKERKVIQELAANNIKRVIVRKKLGVYDPYQILDLQETKTTWHPIGG